jgi:hypothetical protein
LGKAKSDQAGGAGGSLVPGGGGGDLFSGLTALAQSFMPGAPNPNSPNVVDAAQYKPPGAAGPGNAPGPVFDMRGSNLGVDPAGFQQTVTDMTTSQNRWPALAQNLPQP